MRTRQSLLSSIAYVLLPLAGIFAAEPGQRWAVLVGVNDYAELDDLQYCNRDAQALAERLVEVGFPKENVFLVADAASDAKNLPNKANIEARIKNILAVAEPDDLVLVSFSGHGVHIDGKTYLCPTDARVDSPESTMILLATIYGNLERSKASRKLLWVDACRNDPRPAGRRSATSHAESVKGMVESLKTPPEGTLTLASCAADQISWEDDGFGHGVFMHYLLEGLAGKADQEERGNRDERISLLELFNYANINTKRFVLKSRDRVQTPELFGRITGDFEITGATPLSRKFRAALEEGDSAMKRYDYDEATKAYTEAIRIAPHRPDGFLGRGHAFRESNDFESAILDYTSAIAVSPNDGRCFHYRALAMSTKCPPVDDDTDARRAVELLEAAIAQGTADAETHRCLGSSYSARGDEDRAISELTKAISLDPAHPDSYVFRALAYSKEKFDRAIADCTMAIRINPNCARAYHERAHVYEKQGEYDQAIGDITKSLDINPQDAKAFRCRGFMFYNTSEYDKAIADYTVAIEIWPEFTWAYNFRGCAYQRKGEYDRAIADFQKAIELDPKYGDAYKNRGSLYLNKGNLDEAATEFQRAIELDPKSFEAYALSGVVCAAKGEYHRAISYFTKAIEIDSKLAGLYVDRGAAYLHVGEHRRAIADASEAVQIDPRFSNAYRLRADAYMAAGDNGLAEVDRQRVKELESN